VSGVGAQTGRKVGGGQERWIRKVGVGPEIKRKETKNENGGGGGGRWRATET
jgi:hypothetical protein